jgi:hypothetical protein
MTAVDVRLRDVDLASCLEVLRESAQDPMEHTIVDPSLVASMARLVGRIPARQVRPWRPCAQHPQHGVQHIPRVSVGAPALGPRAHALLLGEVRRDRDPLLFGEVHQDRRSDFHALVDPLRKTDRITQACGLDRL